MKHCQFLQSVILFTIHAQVENAAAVNSIYSYAHLESRAPIQVLPPILYTQLSIHA